MCACMDVTTQLELCLHGQTQILAIAACKPMLPTILAR